jgi:uncharacterized membrane protein YphA (DoxX/SURF4 family)
MNDDAAYAELKLTSGELPLWKIWCGRLAAFLLSVLFLIAGIWKITDPLAAAVRLTQVQVPEMVSLPLALALGISETFTGVLLIVPRFRRWGAWLAGGLLVAFIIYIGAYYNVLRGEECNCFPWVKRAVGPAFFSGDFMMLLMAFASGRWAKPPEGKRGALVVLGSVCVFALASYGITVARNFSPNVPPLIKSGDKTISLHKGRVFIFFFDPECLHCEDAAKRLAKLDWLDTLVVSVAVQQPQFGQEFMQSTGMPGVLSTDFAALQPVFKTASWPYAVALENGHLKAAFTRFDAEQPADVLRKLGFAR